MGSGPGGHPGVTIIQLTGNTQADSIALEAALDTGAELLGFYGPDNDLAVFASGYKKN